MTSSCRHRQALVSVCGFYWINVFVWIGNPNMVMALAGNKSDLLDARKVTAEVSKSFSVLTDFSHYEVRILLSNIKLSYVCVIADHHVERVKLYFEISHVTFDRSQNIRWYLFVVKLQSTLLTLTWQTKPPKPTPHT